MASDETRLALAEQTLLQLAEEVAMIKKDQDKTKEWINSHEKEEINRHNTVLNAIAAVGGAVEEIKAKGRNRLAAGDRLAVWIPAIITLIGFGVWAISALNGKPIVIGG